MMDKIVDDKKEYDFFVKYTNIDRLYCYYDNLLRSAEGNYRYNEIVDEAQKKVFRRKCSLLNKMKMDLIQEMDGYYLGEVQTIIADKKLLVEQKTDNTEKENMTSSDKERIVADAKTKDKGKRKK